MLSESQTAAVTIISYKPPSDLNFARYTGHVVWHVQLHALSPFGVYKPLIMIYNNNNLLSPLHNTIINYYYDLVT